MADARVSVCNCAEHNHSSHAHDAADDLLHIDWANEALPRPTYMGYHTLPHISIAEVRPYINWVYFYNLWKVRRNTDEARRIQAEAEALLDELENVITCRPR